MNEAPAEFLWDRARLRLSAPNEAALDFWGEPDEAALAERPFAPEDETARALSAPPGGAPEGRARLTLRPVGAPRACAAEWLTEPDGRLRWRLRDEPAAPEARAGAGFEAAPEPLALFDAGGAPLARNAADRRVFGDSAGLAARFAAPEAMAAARAAALSGGLWSHRAPLRAAAGTETFRVALRRVPDPETGAPALLGSFRPIPQEATAGVAPLALARIAHDLRGPLAAVEGFAERLAAGAAEPEAALAAIRLAAARMRALLEPLVAAGLPPAAGRFDLRRLAEEAARLHGPAAEAGGVRLRVEGDAAAPAAGDETAAWRILGALVANAVEHGAPAGGEVRLRVAAGAAAAEIEVADDGPGMAPDALDAACRSAGRAAAPGRRAGGLGLSNAAALAAEMGGALAFATAPGAGFAARLRLPSAG